MTTEATDKDIAVPRWMMAAMGGTAVVMLTGAVTWLTTLHGQVQRVEVEQAAMRTKIEDHDQDFREIREAIHKIDGKVDKVLEAISDLRSSHKQRMNE